jgi:hypothetical protein
MSEPENFLARWSRRKQQSAEAKAQPEDEAPEVAAPESPNEEPELDLSSLPSIDSIAADTDIRVFLQPGVPMELKRAALRRTWSADPAIRDFVGLAENQWDFTAPEGVPGFGPLRATDDVRRLVAQAMGTPEPATAEPAASAETLPEPAKLAGGQQGESNAQPAAHHVPSDSVRPVRPAPEESAPAEEVESEPDKPAVAISRSHGGALPS